MQYEIYNYPESSGPDDYIVACKSCTDTLLARVPGAYSVPEPAAPDCEIGYDGICDQAPRKD